MSQIVTTPGDISYRAVRSVVYVADALREADFVEVPYLHCRTLALKAAPDIDECTLDYEYGSILREDAYGFDEFEPQDLIDKFVKVTIADTEYPPNDITWYGKIIHESKSPDGSLNEQTQTGRQSFVAVGVLWLADRHPITTSKVESHLVGTEIIKVGLPFNLDPGGSFTHRGNRSTAEEGGTYVFSHAPRTLVPWDAYEACRYLLAVQAPRDQTGGAFANTWEFAAGTDDSLLTWYDITVATDGYSLKAVLDQLIDRRRGVGYYAEFDPTDDKIKVRLFSFIDTPLTLPSGTILPANPDSFELDFEAALDVTAQLSTTGIARYHKVTARGARRTATLTAPVNDVLVRDWTDDERDEYLLAAMETDGYGYLSDLEKGQLNAATRAAERLRHVFTRFKLASEWNGDVEDWHGTETQTWCWNFDISDLSVPLDISCDSGREYVRMPGVRILRSLPFKDRYDYSNDAIRYKSFDAGFSETQQPEFVPPFVYVKTSADPERWEFLDKLNVTSTDANGGRRWAAGLSIIDTEPAIQLQVQPNSLLAYDEWGNSYFEIGETLPEHNPREQGQGLAWSDLYATICCELEEHIEQSVTIGSPVTDAPAQVLLINAPDARFDYVLPYTTVDLKFGVPVVTTTGGAVQDDRERLRDIARAAADWYSRDRSTLDLTYKQVRGLFTIGSLILRTGLYGGGDAVNTVVTSITYDLNGPHNPGSSSPQTTRVVTSYAELDFA